MKISAVLLSSSKIMYVPERTSDGLDSTTNKKGSAHQTEQKDSPSMSCLLFPTPAQAPAATSLKAQQPGLQAQLLGSYPPYLVRQLELV